MPQDKRATVCVEKRLSATPDRIFAAWLDPKQASRFLFATRTGTMVKAEIDARPGGGFLLVDRRDGQDIEHTGTYLEIDPPRRLVFDFAVPQFSAERTRVAVEIRSEGTDSVIAITHDGVLPEYEERTRHGWSTILDGLAVTLS